MRERHVVIVAFDGVQPLDVVGPHEVFAGAGRAAAALGRSGSYRVTLASRAGGTVRAESGLELGTVALPDAAARIDTVIVAGGVRRRRSRPGRAPPRMDPGGRPALPAGGDGVLGRLRGRRDRAHGGPAGHDPLGTRPPARRRAPGADRGQRPHLHPRREVLVERGRHGGDRPLPRVGPGGPGGGCRADGGALARHVPPSSRRPDPVRVTRLGAPRRAVDGTGGPEPRGSRSRGRPPPARRWPPRPA